MQFIAQGPDIPNELLQAHEDGQVVFFCGAGISYPAGLPGFKGLVDDIYHIVGTRPNDLEQQVYERKQYDATLDLLERRLPGQRFAVRKALLQALQPKLDQEGATDTHAALLQLAHDRNGALRLVTTNFDRIFHGLLATPPAADVNTYPAPLLPIPKNSRWNGVVYLHGLLPTELEESELNKLILTSGDFGLAYLIERWASRFVSELFRNFIICFVGYSIDDPVLRYMMDALAADRMLGEVTPLAYAFCDYQSGQRMAKMAEWEAKGVIPILYEIPADSQNDHSTLHKTLKTWSETYRDGVQGKERIVADYALTKPSISTRQDDYVGRMLWALSHSSGIPAKHFADFNPAPSLEWLEPFSEEIFWQTDLLRFGVPPHKKQDETLRFSLIRRPASYAHTPWMAIPLNSNESSQWDAVMRQIARWLLRHLNDPELVIWLANRGGRLRKEFVWMVERELDRFAKLEHDGNTAELEDICTHSPNAIPQPLMRKLWNLLISGRVKSLSQSADLYNWKSRLNRDGLTVFLRLELREILAPKIIMKKPFSWHKSDEAKTAEPATHINELVDCELVLATDHVHSVINDLQQTQIWSEVQHDLINEFQQLLHDALDLQNELGKANGQSDRSYWDLPSISPHWQNRHFNDWVSLIELLRDSWLAIYRKNSVYATRIAKGWFLLPYPTFKRLALFAAQHDKCVSSDEWVEWLLVDKCWWLWSLDTKRETLRLLVLQGARMSNEARQQLESAILEGPPREMYRDDIDPEDWQKLVERSIWLHLAKLSSGGCVLGSDAAQMLDNLSLLNSKWELAENERDEFSHWMSGSGDPDYEDKIQIERAPRVRRELVVWLKKEITGGDFYESDWRDVCRDKFATAVCALYEISRENIWPVEHWRTALQAWSEEKIIQRSWRYVAPFITFMPEEECTALAHGITWWIREASKKLNCHEKIFFCLCRIYLGIQYNNDVSDDDPVTQAINHPVGHITEALINVWFLHKPNDNDGLPNETKQLFTLLCEGQKDAYRYGRVILASRLISLFRVDRTWTEQYLLPELNWQKDTQEARATWEGFLWSPRLYRPLLQAFKNDFLETANHYNELGDHREQYATILTYAALDPSDTFTTEELSVAINSLPLEGLQESAEALLRAIEGAGDQREQYWQNRILPFWQSLWPQSVDLISKPMARILAHLVIVSGDEFPNALATMLPWLQAIEYPNYIVHLLCESQLCSNFPEDALKLLDVIIDDQSWLPRELNDCLSAIEAIWAECQNDSRFQRLREFQRRG